MEDDEEIPYEFSDTDEFLKEYYGVDNDKDFYNAVESDCPDN